MAKDKNQLRANGHINIPNVGAGSECITLTYTIRGLKSVKQLVGIAEQLDDLTSQEGIVNAEISDIGGESETIVGKYKIKACDNDKQAREIKKDCDKLLKKLGGQTTLDPPDEEEEK